MSISEQDYEFAKQDLSEPIESDITIDTSIKDSVYKDILKVNKLIARLYLLFRILVLLYLVVLFAVWAVLVTVEYFFYFAIKFVRWITEDLVGWIRVKIGKVITKFVKIV